MAGRSRLEHDRFSLLARFREVRCETERLCSPLEPEDYQLQSMPECSPPKWHLAHTTWFFETFILAAQSADYRPFHSQFGYLFNSYYESAGARWPRPSRGLLTRPTVAQVYAYRQAIDEQIAALIENIDDAALAAIVPLFELGLNHEQQHQELLLTDLKHGLGLNPLRPAYSAPLKGEQAVLEPVEWLSFPAGVRWIGHQGPGFAFDNEMPRHRVFVGDFAIAARPVASGEYLEFIEAGGYDRPDLWLSDGWAARQRNGWTSPQYWTRDGKEWTLFTLRGERPLDAAEPVCHVSYYEADAFARWAGARLPTEAEWETAVAEQKVSGHFLDSGLHPAYQRKSFFGDVWVWTASSYLAYAGFKPAAGVVGEYNGKFMCNQMVLRGGSCATPAGHVRRTYRNFFPPEARWQFSGLRLARDNPA
jgi:ergothioneine biosynthesis protein EgtB